MIGLEAVVSQQWAALMRHTHTAIKDLASSEAAFQIMRAIFRVLPLNPRMRNNLRQFYICRLSHDPRIRRSVVHIVPVHGWGPLTDGRWSRERFDAEKEELRVLSHVLRKEKW